MSDDHWYYCLHHKTVEQGEGCAGTERLGPYGSRQEAESAIASAAEKTESWDNDPKWNDD